MMTAMKLIRLVALLAIEFVGLAAGAQQAPSPWADPAATLAGKVAGILGPGQAQLTLRNLSTISNDELPVIRRLLVQDLKAHGVMVAGPESANLIRVTLSENMHERLWVAEVVEGDETQVAMVHIALDKHPQVQAAGGVMLRKQVVLTSNNPLLAALETANGLVTLEPEQIVIYAHAADGRSEQMRVGIGQKRPLPRDPRGILLAPANGQGFEAWLAGTHCAGSYTPAQPTGEWQAQCNESDDPWPIVQGPILQEATAQPLPVQTANATPPESESALKAFYNAARDYFTGVVAPTLAVDLPPFYSAVMISRSASGMALLIDGIDGKVQLVENGTLKPIAGTRDWGSDIAALHSGCGAGAQILASASGEALTDSLRAYELPALEAIPVSAPLAMEGTVMALAPSPDSKSVIAIVRNAANDYEVDRVTASCN
jgi:hypothetical protein